MQWPMVEEDDISALLPFPSPLTLGTRWKISTEASIYAELKMMSPTDRIKNQAPTSLLTTFSLEMRHKMMMFSPATLVNSLPGQF